VIINQHRHVLHGLTELGRNAVEGVSHQGLKLFDGHFDHAQDHAKKRCEP
jgi:hypothetical protein